MASEIKPAPAGNGNSENNSMFGHLREDFLASIVVFLVALPLCIGIAVAVGFETPGRALITGIIGGIFVGFFAGSPLQVSGPAAGLFVIVADLLQRAKEQFVDRNPEQTVDSAEAFTYSIMVLGGAVFLAGLLQIAAGKLRIGQWFRAVSPAVIKGMLSGIGILILVSQFHVMLDHQAMWHGEKAHGGLQYMATIPEAIYKCFVWDNTADVVEERTHHLAALIGLVTIMCIVFWPILTPKKIRILPAALVGIVVATLLASFVPAFAPLIKLEVSSNILSEVTVPDLNWLGLLLDPMVLMGGLVIAIVASAETLLCATAVDQMHTGERTKYDKELTAQGIGNVACGLLGALPMTGVIVRSSANVNSGAKTRLSAILHGFWLLLFVAALPWMLAYIPKAALGALLVYTGFKLVNYKEIFKLWQTSRSEVLIYLVTVTVIVCEDLLVGVVVGILLSSAKLLHRFSQLDTELINKPGVSVLRLHGSATFLRLPMLAAKLEEVPESAELHVDFEHLSYIDHACLDLLMNWAKQHEKTGGKLVLDWSQLHARFSSDSGIKNKQAPNDDGSSSTGQAAAEQSAN